MLGYLVMNFDIVSNPITYSLLQENYHKIFLLITIQLRVCIQCLYQVYTMYVPNMYSVCTIRMCTMKLDQGAPQQCFVDKFAELKLQSNNAKACPVKAYFHWMIILQTVIS